MKKENRRPRLVTLELLYVRNVANSSSNHIPSVKGCGVGTLVTNEGNSFVTHLKWAGMFQVKLNEIPENISFYIVQNLTVHHILPHDKENTAIQSTRQNK